MGTPPNGKCAPAPRSLIPIHPSVVVGDQAAPWLSDLPVMPDAGPERQQPLGDPGAQAGQGMGAVALRGELVLELVEDRLDPLAHATEVAETSRLAAAVWAQEGSAEEGDELFDLSAGEPFVADHRVAVEVDSFEHPGDDLALGLVGGGQLEGDRHPVGGGQQVELEAPEVARVRSAVAVGSMLGELRSPHCLARLPAGDRGGVDKPQPVAPGGGDPSQIPQQPDELGSEVADPLVVAGLTGDVGEEVAETTCGEADEASLY